MTIEEIIQEKEETERKLAAIIKEFKQKLPAGVFITQIRPMVTAHNGTLIIIDLSL